MPHGKWTIIDNNENIERVSFKPKHNITYAKCPLLNEQTLLTVKTFS